MNCRGHGCARAAARGLAALPAVGLICLLLALSRLPMSAMPQVVKGDDVLSVAFGDARAVIARMMIEKSDRYFHGGVDLECPMHGKDCGCHHDEDHRTAQSNNRTIEQSEQSNNRTI